MNIEESLRRAKENA